MSGDILKQFRDEQKISTVHARNIFSKIINRSFRTNERVLLMRHGKPIAIIVSQSDLGYLRKTQPREEIIRSSIESRRSFSDTFNHAAFGHRRVVVTKHGRQIAAIVPLEDFRLLAEHQYVKQKDSPSAYNIVDARSRLTEIIDRAYRGKERIGIIRRGELVAAVVPIEDLRRVERYERDVEAGIRRPAIQLTLDFTRLKH